MRRGRWRLNGEYITNPDETPDRFNTLTAGDFAIFDFEGELFPTAARAVFVSANLTEDARLHAGIRDAGNNSMRAIELAELHLIAVASGTPESHPVWELLLDASIEDAALNGLAGTEKLLKRTTGRKLTRAALERARQRADDVGRLGEELVNTYFSRLVLSNQLDAYQWIADDNAISPHDFRLGQPDSIGTKVEVKSTTGDFSQTLHVSIAQLIEMRDSSEQFDLYRIYALDEQRASLRIKRDMKEFGRTVIESLANLPSGITVDSISVRPETLEFESEIVIDLPTKDAAEA